MPFNFKRRRSSINFKRLQASLFHGAPLHPEDPPLVTNTLLVLNLAFFTAMVAQGMLAGQGFSPLLNPDPYLLLHGGAQYWPLVINEHEWWRCITYAFTHGGIIHLAFNMLVLRQIGPLLEADLGPPRYLVLYLLAAFGGTAGDYFWHPQVPVVGASAALFGLIACASIWDHRLGPSGYPIRDMMLKWAAVAFVFGFVVGADNAGHAGGALVGFCFGGLISRGFRERRKYAPLFFLFFSVATLAIISSLTLLIFSWFR